MTVENGVAYIVVAGTLVPSADSWDKHCGFQGLDEIASCVTSAASDPSVSSIVLDFDSPGGTVRGTPEAAQSIADAASKKRVVAFTSGLCCSGAYWLASQAHEILTTRTGTTGSIGVMMPFIDRSALAEKLGLKVELFKTGKFKGMGVAGTSLTDDQRSHIQERLDQIFTEFKTAVLARGRAISADSMQGQTFYGPDAHSRNLATLCAGFGAALSAASLRAEVDSTGGAMTGTETKPAEAASAAPETPQAATAPETPETPAQAASEPAEPQSATTPEQSPESAEAAPEESAADFVGDEPTEGDALAGIVGELSAINSTLQALSDRLKALEEKPSKPAAQSVAEQVAAITGNQAGDAPLGVTAATGGEQPQPESLQAKKDRLWAECTKIADPTAQRAFYEQHIKPLQ